MLFCLIYKVCFKRQTWSTPLVIRRHGEAQSKQLKENKNLVRKFNVDFLT
jgi:hypothetical protein